MKHQAGKLTAPTGRSPALATLKCEASLLTNSLHLSGGNSHAFRSFVRARVIAVLALSTAASTF